MIVIRMRGRLGNQLFIYALGRALQERYKQDLVIIDNENDTGGSITTITMPENIKRISYNTGFKYNYYKMKAEDYSRLHHSPLDGLKKEQYIKKICKENNLPIMPCKQRLIYYVYKLCTRFKSERERYEFEEKHKNFFCSNGLFLCENGYIDFTDSKETNMFCFGYFQSENYFKLIKTELLKEIQPNFPLLEQNKTFVDHIRNTESVCLSIRMGDYLNNPVLGVCTPYYYQRAIDRIYELCPKAVFFVFSDDVEAVKRTYSFQSEIQYEPDGNIESEKLRYMSQCKYFILSNSSFSWWAQFLATDNKKMVIAPDKWFAKDIPCDIYQKEWETIPCVERNEKGEV